jgi:predicted enzyme related to lactoylglutathione lyase
MRSALVAMAVAVAVLIGQVQTDSKKSMPADVGPGRVAWFDLTTTDLAKSKEFYGKLLDWKFKPVQGTNFAVEVESQGSSIGTIRVAEGAISAFNGVIYVQVTDLPASCKKAKELGATIPPGFPFDLPNGTGAVGLLVDPVGHPVGLYSRTPLAAAKPPAK